MSDPRNSSNFFQVDSITYQKRKLHIDNIRIDCGAEEYERQLLAFLERFGKVIDLKILKNSFLTRDQERVRSSHVSGRHDGRQPGSHSAGLPQQDSQDEESMVTL